MRANARFWIGALGVACAMTSLADTNGFFVPGFRGQPGTTFDGWEVFTVAVGNPGNAGDLAGSSGEAALLQKAVGATVLGSGNIYNGETRSLFELRYSGAEPVDQVMLQVRTLGTELSYESVKLFAWTESLGVPRTELDRTTFGGPPGTPGSGVAVSSLWSWDISSLDTDTFAIAFDAADINLSLDSATLDVKVVPEPGPLVLGILGGLALYAARRRT